MSAAPPTTAPAAGPTVDSGYVVDDIGRFAAAAGPADIPPAALTALKRNVLDGLGAAIAALEGELITGLRHEIRRDLYATDRWPPPGGPEHILEADSIMAWPADFSPLV
jgi:hypothetical protein